MAAYGRFIPKHPEKYRGDAASIFFRSSWEVTVMKYFDCRTNIISWGSEEIQIPYLSPKDNKIHMYHPDFNIVYRDADGNDKTEIVEVKPLHESEEKFAKSDRSKAALLINEAKWKAAIHYCNARDMQFRVITEASIFHHGQKKQKKSK